MFLRALLWTGLLFPAAGFACEDKVALTYAAQARPHSRYLAITKVPITRVAELMARPTLEMPRWTESTFQTENTVQWEEPRFRWVNERWRNQDLTQRQTTEALGDAVIALFDLDLLDEGWFELRCPHGQVPGRRSDFSDYDTPHLEPGAVRVNAGVSYDTAEAGFRRFRRARDAFFSFRSAGMGVGIQAMIHQALGNDQRSHELFTMSATLEDISPLPPTTEVMWRHFVGFAVHPQSPHRAELREQIRRGRAGTRRFADRELYRELDVIPFQ